MRRSRLLLSAGLMLMSTGLASAQNNTQRNLILFIPDGLRALKVSPETAPAMAEIRDKGVNLKNSHSLFPTFTMANGSAMSTGHYLGDTGVFSNTIYTAYTSVPAGDTVVPFIENDAVLGDIDEHFNGNYLNEETILKLARDKQYSTAAIGKLGPTFQFDHTDRPGEAGLHSIVLDDATGGKNSVPLSEEMKAALTKAGLPLATPPRGDNSKAGDAKTPGTTVANVAQQAYLADVTTKVVLPMFKARGKPFVLVFWSRDPDGSQHNTGDSLNQIKPGINGPTSMAGIKNADNNLAQIRKALDELGLAASTNIIVSADHGFSTISKESKTSPSAKVSYDDTPKDFLPMGFVALDLAKALDLPLFDPNDKNAKIEGNKHPKAGNGVLGKDPTKPDVVVATNGGSDLIYIPSKDRKLARKVINALLQQDYVSGLFVHDDLGNFLGTLPLSQLSLKGKAATPHPAIVVNFRSYASDCGEAPTNCSVQVADTVLRQGQGMHGSFSRGDTMNFMAAIGPDFKAGYVDELPVSNADVGATAAKLMGLTTKPKGSLIGRVMTEAMPNGETPKAYVGSVKSRPTESGLRTVLNFQRVGSQRYFDTAGFPGRTLGLEAEGDKQKTAGK
ncbi:alkaline phosphatase family protein [Bradyrhizobium manausense]|uniref:alkaline phosphatase family protein n=1 Tax=Bradyrhizobium TaxID=374 RepID=UPI001BA7CA1A|nr:MULTISPECIES: alkaline phosphatase family protein [Bradyrhizobium]MBR0828721.1 alkaline phosphatase family protein [Bradyrhizobium manausense]UVO32575.1 alkaline phosphatase family protein [Bradyrhizobium arachidis]